jgi:hypothetical protein
MKTEHVTNCIYVKHSKIHNDHVVIQWKFKCWLTELKCCRPWLTSIHRNRPASYLVLAKQDHINSPLFSKLRMLALIHWGWGSTFLAIETSSLHDHLKLYANNSVFTTAFKQSCALYFTIAIETRGHSETAYLRPTRKWKKRKLLK